MADKYISVAGAGAKTGVDWANAYSNAEFQTALDSLGASDSLIGEAGTYTQSAALDIDVANGLPATRISVIGVNPITHLEDGSKIVIDANSVAANGLAIAMNYWMFRNIEVVNATGDGITLSSANNNIYYNVSSNNNGAHGIDGSDTGSIYIQCDFSGNTNNGSNATTNGRFSHCNFMDNGSNGLGTGTGYGILNHCILHNNSSRGVAITDPYFSIVNCILDGNGDGVETASITALIQRTRITNNTEGIDGNQPAILDRNAFYGNGTDQTGTHYQIGDDITLTSDGYADRAADDFTLESDGEGVGITVEIGGIGESNIAYMTVGANPPQYVAGGGGRRPRMKEYGI